MSQTFFIEHQISIYNIDYVHFVFIDYKIKMNKSFFSFLLSFVINVFI